MKVPQHSKKRTGAFTLIELLVATVVLTLVVVMVAGMTNGTMQVTGQSQRRINADAGARQILDRLSSDFSEAVARPDLPMRLDKNTGNDGLAFLASAPGYEAGRGISILGYRATNSVLERGAEATSWDGSNAPALAFRSLTNAVTSTNYLAIKDDNYEVAASDVFRLEIAFLMGDGSIAVNAGTNIAGGTSFVANIDSSTKGVHSANTIRAVIIGIAALDRTTRENLGTNGMSDLMSRFPDAANNEDILTTWNNYLSDTSTAWPPRVRESVRIYQRYVFLNN